MLKHPSVASEARAQLNSFPLNREGGPHTNIQDVGFHGLGDDSHGVLP